MSGLICFEDNVTNSRIGTGQNIPLVFFRIGNDKIMLADFLDISGYQLGFAFATITVTTAIIKRQSCAESGFKD